MSQETNKLGQFTPDIREFTATGSSAIDSTVVPVSDFRLLSVTIHFASNPADGVTVSIDALAGTAYDTVLNTIADSGADFSYVPTMPLIFKKGNGIKVAAPNAGNITYGLVISYEIL